MKLCGKFLFLRVGDRSCVVGKFRLFRCFLLMDMEVERCSGTCVPGCLRVMAAISWIHYVALVLGFIMSNAVEEGGKRMAEARNRKDVGTIEL